MLNIAKPAVAAPLYQTRQYVVWPTHGVCVVGGTRTAEVAGMSLTMLNFHPLKENATVMSVPLPRLASSSLRLPASVSEMSAALDVFNKEPVRRAKIWSKAAQDHEAAIRQGDVASLTGVLHSMLSKHRNKTITAQNVDPDLRQIEQLSYSERVLAFQARDLLAQELSFVGKMPQKDAAKLIMACALVPGHAKTVKLKAEFDPVCFMGKKDFDLYYSGTNAGNGFTIGEIKERPRNNGFFAGSTAPPQKRFSRASVETQNTSAGKAGRGGKKLVITSDSSDPVTVDRNVYEDENALVPATGTVRSMFAAASRTLSTQEFQVLSRMTLRTKNSQESLQDVSKALNMSAEQVLEIRNAAAAKMRVHYTSKSSYLGFAACNPHVEKERRAVAAKPEKPEKPTFAPREDLREIVGNEKLVSKGPAFSLLLVANTVLNRDEFSLLMHTAFMPMTERKRLSAYAARKGMTRMDAAELHNEAVRKIREKLAETNSPLANSNLLEHIDVKRGRQKAEKSEKPAFTFRDDLKDAVAANKIVTKGPVLDIVKAANIVSTAEEFAVLAKTVFAPALKRISPETYARRNGMEIPKAVELHNGALEKIREHLRAAKSDLADHRILDKVELKQAAAKPPRPAKARHELVFREDLRDIVSSLKLTTKGPALKIIAVANDVLTREEFALIVKTKLVPTRDRISVRGYARANDGMTKAQVGEMHNKATRKIREKLQEMQSPLASHMLLQPLTVKPDPVQRTLKAIRTSPEIPDTHLETYLAEKALNAPKSGSQGWLRTAAKIMSPEEYKIFAQTELRPPAKQRSYQDVAAEMGMTVQQAIALRDSASAKLRGAVELKGRLPSFRMLNPYQPPVEKEVRAPKQQTEKAAAGRQARAQKEKDARFASADHKKLFDTEASFFAAKGMIRGVAITAANMLDAKDFTVLSGLKLRREGERMSVDAMAEKMNISREDVRVIHNRAVAALKPVLPEPSVKRLTSVLAELPQERPAQVKAAPVREAVPASRKAKEPMRDQTLDSIPEKNRAIYTAENRLGPVKGPTRALMLAAARQLDAESYAVVSALRLRRPFNRIDLPTYAKIKGVDEAHARAVFDNAVVKLHAALPASLARSLAGLLAPIGGSGPSCAAKTQSTPCAAGGVPEALSETFAREAQYVPVNGTTRAIFNRAAQLLNPGEFEAFSRSKMRERYIEPLHQQAKERNIPMARLIALHDSAVKKLSDAFAEEGNERLASAKILRVYEKPAAATLRRN
jgi:CarD family transcriptional regulator